MQKECNRINGVLLLIVLVEALIIIVLMIGVKSSPHSVDGTYSAGNEPSMDNIYLVIKNEQFVIQSPEKLLEEGTVEKIEANGTDVYKMFSGTSNWNGYMIHKKNDIILLNFMDTEVQLEKISKNAIYTYLESK